MKIGELSEVTGVSVDALRYYEKARLLPPSQRAANGYRRYGEEHVERVRFVRSAQALGFSHAEILDVIPLLASGQFGRAQIEQLLNLKLKEIDQRMDELSAMRRDLIATFESLRCAVDSPVSTAASTLDDHGAPAQVRPLGKL